MSFFSIIEHGRAIIHCRGVYRQVPIYSRAGKIYAKYGGGLVKLAQGGSSSAPNVRWAEIDPGEGEYREEVGSVYYTAPIREAAE